MLLEARMDAQMQVPQALMQMQTAVRSGHLKQVCCQHPRCWFMVATTAMAPLHARPCCSRIATHEQAASIGQRSTVPLSIAATGLHIAAEPLSRGAESTVLAGNYAGRDVAIKRVRLTQSEDWQRFCRELQLLAGFRHPNVIQLLGACPSELALPSCCGCLGCVP